MANARWIQCHFWLSKEDYTFLRLLAQERDEPISALLRRVIRRMRQAEQAARSAVPVTRDEVGVAARDARLPPYSTRTSR